VSDAYLPVQIVKNTCDPILSGPSKTGVGNSGPFDKNLSELAARKVNAAFKLDGYVYEFQQSEFASIVIFVNDCIVGIADHIKWTKLF
jgi:hypothetical protein